jgi:ubiquitin carboxyl-terminal hydrolase 10
VKTAGHKESITIQPFQSLQLDVSSVNSVLDAILNVTKEEILEDYNSLNITTKQSFFESIPPILILSLNRFVYNVILRSTEKVFRHGYF